MIVDMHAHLVPAALERALGQRERRPFIERSQLAMPIGEVSFGREFVDSDRRVELMDQLGISVQVLSLPGLFGVDSLPAAEAVKLTRLFNDGAAEACAAWPGRFYWLACLPLDASREAEAILQEAMVDKHCLGAILPDLAFATSDRAKRIESYLSILQDRGGGHLFVHPGYLPGETVDASPYADLAFARRQVHIQNGITEAAITLLHSDLLFQYPDVTIQIANLAGTLPMVSERIDQVVAARAIVAQEGPRKGQIISDCASMGPHAIALAHAILGADCLVFGSDCPIFELAAALRAVGDAPIPAEGRDQILHETAARVLAASTQNSVASNSPAPG